ncbi:MAG: acyloxyacyl hydrolase [Dichotomicrobium sp.]
MIRMIAARSRVLQNVLFAALAAAGPCLTVAAAAEPLPQETRIIDEIRLGALVHDLESNDNEDGWDVNVEALFHRLGPRTGDPLDILLSPRPHVGVSLNTSGDTNVGYFGLTWDARLTETLFVEASFGGALHDGPTGDSNDSFGCTANFREAAAVGLALAPGWNLLATVSHVSNGGACGQNQGLTSTGVQVGYHW